MSLLHRLSSVMQGIAPLSLADSSWDNVGILVESPAPNQSNTIMLTIDLTPEVMEECLQNHVEVIVAYHPPIFRPMKRLTMQDAKQTVLLKAIQAGMSIYSPHTSLDAAEGGINDWLISLIDEGGEGKVRPIQPTSAYAPHAKEQTPQTGMGRVVQLKTGVEFGAVVQKLKEKLNLATVRVSIPESWTVSRTISTVAVCAGSGSGVFRCLRMPVDVLISGEMSHHEVLAAKAANQAVILCEHTNTERGYLGAVLKGILESKLDGATVLTSSVDYDPLVVW